MGGPFGAVTRVWERIVRVCVCVCVVKALLCFCSSGSGPLPAVTETLTAAEDLQTASQVTGPVGDPHTAKLFIISLSPSH